MASIFKWKCALTDNGRMATSAAPTLGTYVLGVLAFTGAALVTIAAVGGIADASRHTKELLACRIRLTNSSDATEEDEIRVAELQESIWVISPKWAFALTVVLIGVLIYPTLSVMLLLAFLRMRQKILSFVRPKSIS